MSPVHTLHSISTIRRIEQHALASLPAFTLMQRAGAAATAHALELLKHAGPHPAVLILVGPGNNGGDALEVAYHLMGKKCRVSLVMLASPASFSTDAAHAWQRAVALDPVQLKLDDIQQLPQTDWDLVVDGLFGIGLSRPISGQAASLINAVNQLSACVLALDVPSGLDADTGNIVGASDGCAIEATHTITFIADKPGLHTGNGRDYAGCVRLSTLEISAVSTTAAHLVLNQVGNFAYCLQARRHNTHKGSYGDVVVVGGARGMTGAAMLASRSAAMLGAGRVFVASPDNDVSIDPQQPEIMWRNVQQMTYEEKSLIVGPGLGTTRDAHDALVQALVRAASAVLDADALNILAEEPGLQKKLRGSLRPLIFTPHPLEAARLLKCSVEEVQSDRIATARTLAARLDGVVVLKGSGSIIAHPNGIAAINPTGNPALATAGSGDVLSGACGALLAQGWPAWEAALAATWIHGTAADSLVAHDTGPIGLLAGELIPEMRRIFNHLVAEQTKERCPQTDNEKESHQPAG